MGILVVLCLGIVIGMYVASQIGLTITTNIKRNSKKESKKQPMDTWVWILIGIVVVVVWGLIIWEIKNTPPMPPDFTNEPDEWDKWHPDSDV